MGKRVDAMLNRTEPHAVFTALLLTFLMVAAVPAEAYTVPLPEESVRDAYFLGQRRGGPAAEYLSQYQKNFAAPTTGPWISSIRFLTPFAQLVLHSSAQQNYNAQQAVIDHRGQRETISIQILVQFTKSYPALIAQPTGSRSGSPSGLAVRPSDFWKYFRAQVSAGDEVVEPTDFTGEPNYICGQNNCSLVGATLYMEFLAEALNTDSVTVRVLPPEGSEVVAEFATARLR
jgi:hypothetical protein